MALSTRQHIGHTIMEASLSFLQYLPIGAVIGILLLAELTLIAMAWVVSPESAAVAAAPAPAVTQVTNARALGQLLYTDYFYLFQAAGLVLLIAMIGAIVLTLRVRSGVRRQRIAGQVARRREEVVEVRDVPIGSGA